MDSNSDLRSRRQEYCQLDHHHDDPRNVIFKGPFPASFFFIFVFSTVNSKYVHYKISLMTGFDLWYRKRTLCQRGHNHCPPEMYFPIKSWRHTYLPTYLPRYSFTISLFSFITSLGVYLISFSVGNNKKYFLSFATT